MRPSLLRRMVTVLRLREEPEPLGGATGAVWAFGGQVLRIGPQVRMEKELVAMEAASHAVHVPRVVDRVDLEDQSGVLMERIRGAPAGDLSSCTEAEAHARGRLCGSVHRALAAVPGPAALPTAPGVAPSEPSPALLHLDLHPFNVLLGEAETPTVIDWANAASGPADLDLARTAMMMTFDPAARAHTGNPRWTALVEGWSQESGWDEIHDPALAWALRFMMRDLSRRYSQAQLVPIAARLAELGAT